jgi:hypothetical protein
LGSDREAAVAKQKDPSLELGPGEDVETIEWRRPNDVRFFSPYELPEGSPGFSTRVTGTREKQLADGIPDDMPTANIRYKKINDQ